MQIYLYRMDLFSFHGMECFFYKLNVQENAVPLCYGNGIEIEYWDLEDLIYILWNGLHLKAQLLQKLKTFYYIRIICMKWITKAPGAIYSV